MASQIKHMAQHPQNAALAVSHEASTWSSSNRVHNMQASFFLQRADMITKHQFALQLIGESTVIPNYQHAGVERLQHQYVCYGEHSRVHRRLCTGTRSVVKAEHLENKTHAGVERLQHQYVCYGEHGRVQVAPDGWSRAESDAEALRRHDGGEPADPALPQRLTLTVVTAPAEFCVPTKQDRQFTPSFRLQV